MADLLKDMYNPALVAKLSAACAGVDPLFNTEAFTRDVFDATWPQRELKQRMRHLTEQLQRHLSGDYAQQLASLYKISVGFGGFTAILFSDFVAVFGTGQPDLSIPALAHFTMLCSSEFAVRPYLIQYPERMLAQHLSWADSDNHHLRRLASEGIRPRLPWGQDVPWIKKDPALVLPVLEKLKNDPSEYVRRSVANNLNDISKINPELVLEVARRWKGSAPETDKLLKHALRGLLKKGNAEALALFGFEEVLYEVENFGLDKTEVRLGEKLGFEIVLRHTGKKPALYRLEYVIHYRKANGKTSPKVFQISEKMVNTGESLKIRRNHAFADLTTRKHYAGEHHLAIHLNGTAISQASFELLVP